MFLSKLGYSELVQRLFEKNYIFSCGPPLEMRTRMRSSRARTQYKTLTATCALESAAPIGRIDKSNYQLEDDGERGRDSGRKRQRQQQHGRAPAVNFASSSAAAAGGGGQRRRQAAMATVGSGRQWQRQRHLRLRRQCWQAASTVVAAGYGGEGKSSGSRAK